jgi:hypothetical protein
MVAKESPRFGQLPLDLPEPPNPHQIVIDILRDEYLRNNGDLRPFLAKIAARRPKPRDNSELWSLPGRIVSKSKL